MGFDTCLAWATATRSTERRYKDQPARQKTPQNLGPIHRSDCGAPLPLGRLGHRPWPPSLVGSGGALGAQWASTPSDMSTAFPGEVPACIRSYVWRMQGPIITGRTICRQPSQDGKKSPMSPSVRIHFGRPEKKPRHMLKKAIKGYERGVTTARIGNNSRALRDKLVTAREACFP